jgi:hypothetical protein
MAVSGFYIQSILKTYHKSIRWSSKKAGGHENRSHDRDKVKLSVEGRKRQICQRAASHVIEKLTRVKKARAALPEESR